MNRIKADSLTKEQLLELKAKYTTQAAVANAVGCSRATITRLTKKFSISWPVTRNIHGNAEWQALGE